MSPTDPASPSPTIPPIFDAVSLHHAVQIALQAADIPESSTHAFAVALTTHGMTGVYSQRINDVWKIDTVFSIDRNKHWEGGVQVKADWGP